MPKKNQNICSLLFFTFSAMVANPKKLLYTVANSARGRLDREKITKIQNLAAPPPPSHAAIIMVRRE